VLAGISIEYYVRLEQGRDRHPSALVLDALARALQLDEHATAHLHQLAAPAPRRARRRKTERVSAQIDVLLRSLDGITPAYISGRLMNALAANQLAVAVFPLLAPGNNFVRAMFLDPIASELYDDIEGRQAAAVAGLRAFTGPTLRIPSSPSSSGSCRSRARSSAAFGHATTSSPCTEPCPGWVSVTPTRPDRALSPEA
jgi:hypothetical protein